MSTTAFDTTTGRVWKRYPECRATEVDWLGMIPSHWQILPLKRVASLQSGENITADSITPEGSYPVYGGNGLRGYTTAATHSGHYVLVGRQGALCGNINYANGQFWASEHAVVVTPRLPVAVLWLGETLRTMNLGQYSISSAQPGLSVDRIIQFPIPVPPLSEQRAIAAFLVREMARIDELIERKERLIALMEEKRQALISHVVTRGLDSAVSLKDSGIAWLGNIPNHWKVCALKRTWRQCDYGLSDSLADTGEVRVLTMGNVQRGEVLIPEEGSWENVPPEMLLADNDLVFNRTNSLIHVGKVGVFRAVPGLKVSFASYLVRIRFKESAVPAFMNYFLNQDGFLRTAQSVALPSINQANLNPTRYGALHICLPPVAEQRAITAVLDRETERNHAIIARIRDGIARLQEYRIALVSAAVTGQIDVRDEVEQ